jgi:hypothetical protein
MIIINKATGRKREIHQSKIAFSSTSKLYVHLIIGTVLLVLGIGEWVVRSLIVPIPSTTPYQVNLIYTKDNRDVAVGDSHIYRAFIANDGYLNLGVGGTTIPMMKIVVEQYFKYKQPGKVIIEVAPQLFSEDYLRRDTQGYERYFNQNYPLPIKIYIFEPGIGSWIENIKSLNDFSRLTNDRIEGEGHITLEGKWKNLSPKDRKSRTRSRIRKQEPIISDSQEVIKTYRKMIEFLLDRGADVCMFRTPVDETYLRFIKDDPSFTESLEIFQNISVDYGVRFVDFQDLDYDFSLDKFINQDHITPKASADIAPLVDNACFDE